MSFESFGLAAEILRAVREQDYTIPTPIQSAAIPLVLAGRDIMAGAQTGTGKTAGFTLPMLHRLSQQARPMHGRQVRALVLTPTRELAAQVNESVRTYGKYLKLGSTVIFGGVSYGPQVNALRRGTDIVVATPGRLLDHAGQGNIDLSKIEILVLDEADRMLDMGFIHDIRQIISMLPARGQRQTLMFSATFSAEIRTLAAGLLEKPELIEAAGTNNTATGVTQRVHPVDGGRKRELLSHMIGHNNWRQVLVFTRTKHGANRLAQQLEDDGLESAAIHGNKSQGARTKALAQFKSGQVRVLVATDIAARGLDISELPHVVNFDLPSVPEDYVHRIGRTGRAGREGEAISLVSGAENGLLRDIERLLGRRLDRVVLEGYEPSERNQSAANEELGVRQGNGRNHGPSRGTKGRGGNPRGASSRGASSRSTGSRDTASRDSNSRGTYARDAGSRSTDSRDGNGRGTNSRGSNSGDASNRGANSRSASGRGPYKGPSKSGTGRTESRGRNQGRRGGRSASPAK